MSFDLIFDAFSTIKLMLEVLSSAWTVGSDNQDRNRYVRSISMKEETRIVDESKKKSYPEDGRHNFRIIGG